MEHLPVQLLHPQARMPARAHDSDLGYDLAAAAPQIILPGDWSTVQTGVALALPPGLAGLILPRSGLAAKHGVTVLNGPGLIDGGFRDGIGVVLLNHSDAPFHVAVGDRIAQLLLVPVALPELHPVAVLPPPGDGRAGGFGSSGR